MRASELRELTVEELQLRLQEARRELFNLRQRWYAGGLENVNAMKAARKEIARILTILRERELAEALEKGEAV